MRKIFAFHFLFFLSFYSYGQLIVNGGFDDLSNAPGGSCTFQIGQYVYAFGEGCLGPQWGSAQGSPSVRASYNAITPLSAPYMAFTVVRSGPNKPCNRESYFYNVELDQGVSYELTFAVRGFGNHEADMEIYATRDIQNNPPVFGQGDVPCGTDAPTDFELIHVEEDIPTSGPWQTVTVNCLPWT